METPHIEIEVCLDGAKEGDDPIAFFRWPACPAVGDNLCVGDGFYVVVGRSWGGFPLTDNAGNCTGNYIGYKASVILTVKVSPMCNAAVHGVTPIGAGRNR